MKKQQYIKFEILGEKKQYPEVRRERGKESLKIV